MHSKVILLFGWRWSRGAQCFSYITTIRCFQPHVYFRFQTFKWSRPSLQFKKYITFVFVYICKNL